MSMEQSPGDRLQSEAAGGRFFNDYLPEIEYDPGVKLDAAYAYDLARELHGHYWIAFRYPRSLLITLGINENREFMDPSDLHRDELPGKMLHKTVMLGLDVSMADTIHSYCWQLSIVDKRKFGGTRNDLYELYAHRLGLWRGTVSRYDGQGRQTNYETTEDNERLVQLFQAIAHLACLPEIRERGARLVQAVANNPAADEFRQKQQASEKPLNTDDMMSFSAVASVGWPAVPWRSPKKRR